MNSLLLTTTKAVPWLRRSVASLSTRRPGFDPGSAHVAVVVDKVALGQVFLRAPLKWKSRKKTHHLRHRVAFVASATEPLKKFKCQNAWLIKQNQRQERYA